jgi:hypothetical protein
MIILFYGNCQVGACLKTLNLSNDYEIHNIYCWHDFDIEYFKNKVMISDIIITQPINDHYKGSDCLSTSYIIKNKKKDCKIIIIDSCHFDFYYVDLTYKWFNDGNLQIPIPYHYDKMIECYNNNQSIEYYITNVVNNLDLKTSEELDTCAQNSLNELDRRNKINNEKYNEENTHLIHTYDYVKENYKNKLLFYSMNHPTKYLIQFICEKIIDILQIQNTINYDIDPLDATKCILYKCISKNVNFDIDDHNALTLGITDVEKITQLYYNTYKEIGYK